MPVEFVGGLRVSDEATVEVAKMVLVGKVNKEIVLRLEPPRPAGGRASAATTARCSASRAAPRPAARTSASSGAIERVNAGVIEHIASDYIPVIASVGADREGNSYNVNADEAAGAVAGALRRLQGDLPDRRAPAGCADPADPGSLIAPGQRRAGARRARRASRAACARSSRPASTAIDDGVSAAHILDGRVAALAAARAVHRRGIGTKIEAMRHEPRRAAGSSSARA